MGLFDRLRRNARRESVSQPPEVEPTRPVVVRHYRDPLHPERPPHPHKVARALYASQSLALDDGTVERECEIAGVDPAPVYAELEALRTRDQMEEADRRSGWREPTRTINFDAERVADLRPLGGKMWRAVGAFGWLSDRERRALRAGWFVLKREPQNPYDVNAVAVYLDCRKVGYLSAAKAKALSPLLAAIPADGYEVSGEVRNRTAYVALPTPSALRLFVGRSAGAD